MKYSNFLKTICCIFINFFCYLTMTFLVEKIRKPQNKKVWPNGHFKNGFYSTILKILFINLFIILAANNVFV